MSVSNSPAYLIDDKILLDIPNGTNKALIKMKYNIQNLQAIFITHFHGDHFFDLPFVLLNLYVNIEEKRNEKLYIVCNKEEINKIKEIIELSSFKSYEEFIDKLNIEIIGIEENFVLDNFLDSYIIKSIEVKHTSPAFGFVINNKNSSIKVGFTGDSAICKGVEEIVKECCISFCDTSEITGGIDSHMGIDNIKYLLSKYANKKIVSTHIREITRKHVLKLQNNNHIIGRDGLEINI